MDTAIYDSKITLVQWLPKPATENGQPVPVNNGQFGVLKSKGNELMQKSPGKLE